MEIKDIVQLLTTIGRRKTQDKIWETTLYYYTSIMINRYGLKKSIAHMKKDIKFFAFLFAQSSAGKSFTVSTIEKIFTNALTNYNYTMEQKLKLQIQKIKEAGHQIDEDDVNKLFRYLPKSPTISLNGTAEGLYEVCNSQLLSNFGSFNLFNDEFGDIINKSSDTLNQLKELYDGSWKAKIIKGDTDKQQLTEDLRGIVSNVYGIGSNKALDSGSSQLLYKLLSSGLFRRSFIINVKTSDIEVNKAEDELELLQNYFSEVDDWLKDHKKKAIEKKEELFIHFSDEAEEEIQNIEQSLIDRYNENKLNELSEYDTGATEIIVDLACLIAIIEKSMTVELKHIKYAFKYFIDTRTTVADLLNKVHHHVIIFNMLKQTNQAMSWTELLEYNPNLPTTQIKVKDIISLLKEYAYQKGYRLHEIEGYTTKYKIEELPVINLEKDKFILSFVCPDESDKREKAIMFKPVEVDWNTITTKLVTSQKTSSFTVSHFLQSTKTEPYDCSHRKDDLFIEGQNLLAFDIDDDMTLEEAKEKLKEYTYCIYTTKSHQKEKNGIICDRFRVLIPTDKKFYVPKTKYKELYKNVEQLLGIENDSATRNPTRLFYTNPDAEVLTNIGSLLSIECCIPSTDKEIDYNKRINFIYDNLDDDELTRRAHGFIKWFIANTNLGTRNDNLYKASKYAMELYQGDVNQVEYFVELLNSQLSEPLPEHEVNTILRRRN
jgi:hypothetical protein